MLSKEHRLPSNAQLYRASFFKTPLFAVKVAKNDLAESRFGFLVRKTVDKRAVKRNRIRRIFRSCIEQMPEVLSSGYDMLFFLERSIIDQERDVLFRSLHTFLSEKGLDKVAEIKNIH